MGWYRLTAGPALADLTRPPAARAFHAATRDLVTAGGQLATRLQLGVPALVDDRGAGLDAHACAALGIEVAPTDGPPPRLSAHDDALAAAWAGLRQRLEAQAPEALERLAGPALAGDLDALEARLGQPVPSDLRALWALHDGQHDDTGGPFDWVLDSVVRCLDVKQMLDELFVGKRDDHGSAVADAGVRAVWWCRRWVPFTSNGAGDHLCVDLDPAPGGHRGQVIEHLHDHERRRIIAPSIAAWIAGVDQRLASGELVLTEERDGRFVGILPRDALTGGLVDLTIRGEDAAGRAARIAASYQAHPGTLGIALLARLRGDALISYPLDRTPFIATPLVQAMARGPGAIHAVLSAAPDVQRYQATVFDIARILAALQRGA